MKIIVIIFIALMLTSCTKYTLHFGKACTQIIESGLMFGLWKKMEQ